MSSKVRLASARRPGNEKNDALHIGSSVDYSLRASAAIQLRRSPITQNLNGSRQPTVMSAWSQSGLSAPMIPASTATGSGHWARIRSTGGHPGSRSRIRPTRKWKAGTSSSRPDDHGTRGRVAVVDRLRCCSPERLKSPPDSTAHPRASYSALASSATSPTLRPSRTTSLRRNLPQK